MGSVAYEQEGGGQGVGEEDEFTVLVTGFAPFKEHFPINPSWEIVKRLPDTLPPLPAKSAAHLAAAGADPSLLPSGKKFPKVRIYKHPEPIRVNYRVVHDIVPRLWDSNGGEAAAAAAREFEKMTLGNDDATTSSSSNSTSTNTETNTHKSDPESRPSSTTTAVTPGLAPPLPPNRPIDLLLHIGMAGPNPHYSLERLAHRTGYTTRDVDGRLPSTSHPPVPPYQDAAPLEIHTEVNVLDVLKRWKVASPERADLRLSEDPGRYLCDFIYYRSLEWLWERGERRRVVFLHVPSGSAEGEVGLGREVAVGLVRAVVESEVLEREGGKGMVREEEGGQVVIPKEDKPADAWW